MCARRRRWRRWWWEWIQRFWNIIKCDRGATPILSSLVNRGQPASRRRKDDIESRNSNYYDSPFFKVGIACDMFSCRRLRTSNEKGLTEKRRFISCTFDENQYGVVLSYKEKEMKLTHHKKGNSREITLKDYEGNKSRSELYVEREVYYNVRLYVVSALFVQSTSAKHSPFSAGQIRSQILRHPQRWNWPSASSM